MIEIGDIVTVAFHNSNFTLCDQATVKHKPQATGDSWVFEEPNGLVHHVSEGCTITLIKALRDD